jgi:DNA (cytosine-5)-methyltransferase 3A
MANYPNTVQLGSVVNVDGRALPKIDLLIGGSPCQSFSFAGKRKGMSTKDEQEILTLDHYLQLKAEGFEFEGQSYLFWEYMRLLNELREKNPNVLFLLENVMMGEKWEKVLSKAIGVNPIMINSSLVSAQNRQRLYWTNIGMISGGLFGDLQSIIEQPKDKGILLKDILETKVDDKYFLSEKMINGFLGHNKNHEGKTGFLWQPTEGNKKGACLRANAALCPTDNTIIVNEKFNNKRLNLTLEKNEVTENCLIDSYNQKIHKDKSITISTRVNASHSTHIFKNSQIRRLTPTECERLQTVKDGYTAYVSDSQRYKMLGNGWTVDVIAHIFSYIK